MTGAEPAPRLNPAEVRALRRAGQRQLKRWARVQLDPAGQQRSAELRQALQTLRVVRDGCELHPTGDAERGGSP